MSKFKIGDKVKCVTPTSACGVEVGGIYTIKDPQHHYGTYYGKRHNHVCLEEVSSTPNEDCLEIYTEEVKQPTSYREMSPDSTVKVKIGNYEFDCPIKELLIIDALSGNIVGEPRTGTFFDNIEKALDTESLCLIGLCSEEVEILNSEDFYQEYFKPFYDKQNEKDIVLKCIDEHKKAIKELEDKYNSL